MGNYTEESLGRSDILSFDAVGTSTTKAHLTTQRKYRIIVFASVEMKNILGGNFKQV